MKQSESSTIELKAVHVEAPKPKIYDALTLVAGLACVFGVIWYGQDLRRYLFPNDRDRLSQRQQELMDEHEAAKERRALHKLKASS